MENTKETKSYSLTEEQQNLLNEQVGLDIKEYTEASKVYSNLKDKHQL